MQLYFSSEEQHLTLTFCRHSHCCQRLRRQHKPLENGKNRKLLRNTKPPPEQPLESQLLWLSLGTCQAKKATCRKLFERYWNKPANFCKITSDKVTSQGEPLAMSPVREQWTLPLEHTGRRWLCSSLWADKQSLWLQINHSKQKESCWIALFSCFSLQTATGKFSDAEGCLFTQKKLI